ncbi:phage tail protein [Acidicapsa dinghuensis]|uniref:Phage tail protein n=1 Tax=Acidicapsa dinghuensis TaxID=2218256 RepID=A0ABW1ELZ2_9BACT|nr:tail fiber protein [Acidicapsa dinghuensis]
MSTPFLSEIKIFSFGFAPKGWALCNGQLLPINQNQAIFSLLGTTYGGDGRVNFGLPNLQGRIPTHMGNGQTLGERGGEPNHTLSIAEIPNHTHTWAATNSAANAPGPTSNLLGAAPEYNGSASNLVAMYPGTLATVGGSQPHENMQPYLTLNFCIALQGIFPSQN